MSKCISLHGEYSEHETTDGFACARCHVFDEEAALTHIGILEAALASTPSPAQPTEAIGAGVHCVDESCTKTHFLDTAHEYAPSPVQGADDWLAAAEAESRYRFDHYGKTSWEDIQIPAFVAGAEWQAQQNPEAALDEVRAEALEGAAAEIDEKVAGWWRKRQVEAANELDPEYANGLAKNAYGAERAVAWLRARAAEVRGGVQAGAVESE